MGHYIDPPLSAKNGQRLKVLFVYRISTLQQDARSLKDQEGLYRRWMAENWERSYEASVLASLGNGESLEREDYLQALELVSTGGWELVLTEDLARICRRVDAHLFCEECEDHQTRLIAMREVDRPRETRRRTPHSGLRAGPMRSPPACMCEKGRARIGVRGSLRSCTT